MSYLIHQLLENSADTFPEKEAVVHGKHRFAYLDIEKGANRIAHWLMDSGVSKGDRVAVLLRNSVDYICSYFGVLKAGGVVVSLNTSLEAREIGQMLSDCSASVLISENLFSKLIRKIMSGKSTACSLLAMTGGNNVLDGEIDGECTSFSRIFHRFPAVRPGVPMIDLDLSSIIYTSGSTGKPKGVMLTHLNVVTNTNSIVKYLELSTEDRCMVILPFYYVYGKSLLNTHFAVSGTVIIDNSFTFPNAVLKNMVEEKATGFAGVPSTYTILLNRSAVARMSFSDLRYLTQAGGHMPARIKERLLEIFPHKDIFIMYGATEASARLSYLEPDQLQGRLNSIGKPIPNVELKIFRQDAIEADVGEEGEIVARGSNVMIGYWNDPNETEKVLKNGWYYTGDLGVYDEERYLYVTGRKRDMIKVGFHKVSANEIEDVLYRYPGIQEAAVIGVPDDVLGEALKAIVVCQMKAKLNKEDIIQFCADFLPAYKVPKEIIFSDGLPKNEAGKILKQKLL